MTERLIGSLSPLGENAVPSGIDKHPVHGPLFLGRTGFDGDAQGDLKHHGGADKAVHQYPFEHYLLWRQELGALPPLSRPGAFGENLSTTGMTEETVAVGDVFRLGKAIVEVSQGRQPCWKLNLRFQTKDMAAQVQKTGRTGWYYRVTEEGVVQEEDSLVLLDRRSPEWSLHRLWTVLYVKTSDREELAAMAQIAHLPDNWRRLAEHRLATRTVEDWEQRLLGSAL